MDMATPGFQRKYLFVLFLIIWFALVAQFVLIIQNRVVGIPETVLRFFCYFTILTNILVGLTVTYQLCKGTSVPARHFRKQSTLAAVAVYITVVGIVYNIALRGLVSMQGLQRIVDELLHVAIPLLYLIWWLLLAPRQQLQWKSAWSWLRYPLGYLLAVMIIGALLPSRFYPYPFLDAYNHGYAKVGISVIVILLLFLILSICAIAFSRLMSKGR